MKLSALNLTADRYGLRTTTRAAADASAPKAAESALSKRLQEMKEGLEKLNSLPSPKEMAKQAAAARVGMLKQRLDGMKKLLAFATPQQAKALARELKEMARELAAAARELGGDKSAGMATVVVAPAGGAEQAAAAQSASAATEQATGEGGEASAAAHEAAQAAAASAHGDAHGKAEAEDAAPNAHAKDGPVSARERTAAASSDSGLRDLIIEVRKKLKDALALVKMQLEKGDREGRRDAAQAERALRKVDEALRAGGGLQLGVEAQGLAADAATGAALAEPVSIPSVGTFINVSA